MLSAKVRTGRPTNFKLGTRTRISDKRHDLANVKPFIRWHRAVGGISCPQNSLFYNCLCRRYVNGFTFDGLLICLSVNKITLRCRPISPQNHVNYRIPRSFAVSSLNTLGYTSFVFELCSGQWALLMWKNALIDTVTLTFEPQNSITSRVSQGIFAVPSFTKFEHFGIIRFYRASAYCCWRAILI